MSALYPFRLTTPFRKPGSRKLSPVFKSLFFVIIASFTMHAAMAQEPSKEEQVKKEAEQKKQEAALMEAKLKANPKLSYRIAGTNEQQPVQLSDEEEKRIANEKEALEKARAAAKMLEQAKQGASHPGVEYTVYTNQQGQVEYKVTNAGKEIYKQQITATGSVYNRKVQAEKEAIYSSNVLRKNPAYPQDALQAEINALINSANTTARNIFSNNNQRTLLDYTFNGGGGTIPSSGTATPYPATISVSGVPLGALVKSVTINGLNHTWADDVDIMVQSPSGTNVILVSDAGGSADWINHNYTFSDAAAVALQDNAVSPSGTYLPTNFGTPDNFPAPGPGSISQALPALSTFGNGNHNGTWNLYIVDDLGGDLGNWSSWSITFTDPPTSCFPINLTGQPSDATVCSGANTSFTVTATPSGISYNWQVNTGSGFTYLTNTGVYSGVNTPTLNITGALTSMNGYEYRCVLVCPDGGLPEISNPATLTVLTSPSPPPITPTSAAICPGGSQAITVGGGPTTSFGGGPGVTIPGIGTSGPGAPYPSTIAVAGLPAVTVVQSVTINGFSHTFPDDVDILLRSPSGVSVVLMSDVGGGTDATGQNFTFSDAAASLMSDGLFNASGTYLPTNIGSSDTWAAPGPGAITQATPSLGSFGAGDNNGVWELFIVDDVGGDIGAISDWSITFAELGQGIFSPVAGLFTDAGLTTPYTAGTPISVVYASPATTTTYGVIVNDGTCNSAPTNITVTVNQVPSITGQPTSGTACAGGTRTFSVTATGTGLTYQWQVDMGSGFVNITTGSPTNPSAFIYTGQTTATLTISDVLPTLNNYKYRCIISGTCTPAATSNEATLTVNSLPSISVSKSNQCAPTVLTASGANTYTWSPASGLSATTGATVTANPTSNTTYTVTGTNTATGCQNTTTVDVKFTPPVPVVAPAAPVICEGTVQPLSITSSSLPPVANTTSSGPISVSFTHLTPPAVTGLNVSGVTGAVQSVSVNFNITHTWDGDVTINLQAPNGNILNLVRERGGSGDNFTNTTISSAATTPVSSGTAPFSGTFLPDGINGVGVAPYLSNVTTFASLFSVPNGTWNLIASDAFAGDDGIITSWSITINYATPDAGVWTPVTGLFTDAGATIPYVAGTAANTVYANPAVTTTYSVTITNSSTETKTFSAGGAVTIPAGAPGSSPAGPGDPYPDSIVVSGLPANAVVKSVGLKGMKHSFPDDIDIVLQSPTGENVILMSDVGDNVDVTGQSYTFDDAGNLMADAALNVTGTYRPTNIGATDVFPAPVGSLTQGTPSLSMFTGDPNGTWKLFIADDLSADVGSLSSWEITFLIPDPVSCTSAPRTVTVTVHTPVVFTAHPQNVTTCQNNNVTFTVAATGTIQTTQWQVSTNGGVTWSNIAGANSTTLSLTNVQPSMNGYRYRCVMSNTGCGPVNSNAAILTVNPLPTVSLSLNPAGQTQLRPGMLTTVTVNSNPAGSTYQWFVNGVPNGAITGSSYTVDAYHLGTYSVRVTDVNGCVNTTSGVTFTALPSSNLFIYPNPTSGAFYVSYYVEQPGSPVTVNVIDMKGRKIIERHEVTTGPYHRIDFSAGGLAAGVYVIEFRNPSGERLAAGRLVVTR
jgi:subtilisin-like proprotein convertase family protein